MIERLRASGKEDDVFIANELTQINEGMAALSQHALRLFMSGAKIPQEIDAILEEFKEGATNMQKLVNRLNEST